MRVIAGTARGLTLRTIPGLDTRPTTDRIKETLFNILQPEIPDCRFLDLFSGSGAIGIEALSRGAAFAGFVEKSFKAARCIEMNLSHTGLKGKSFCWIADIFHVLEVIEREEPFDCIFMDPPYGKGLEKRVLAVLANSTVLAPEGLIVVETDLETDFSYLNGIGFSLAREKTYKTNRHLFIRRKKSAEGTEEETRNEE